MSNAVVTTPIVKDLQHVLEMTSQLYARTHLAHWNVTGPYFPQLHALYDQQYNELWLALDLVAERIRSLGAPVEPAVFSDVADVPADAHDQLTQLAAEHRNISTVLRSLEVSAAESGDPGTADMAIERLRAHDQMAWMLEVTSKGWSA